MKKILCVFFAFTCILGISFAKPTESNQRNEENWTKISYENVPVLKILDSQDGYVVIYQKNRHGVGKTVIPKSWAKYSREQPRKLRIRSLPKGKLKSYMTIVKNDGVFSYVILTVPAKKSDLAWGVVPRGTKLDVEKEELEELEL